VFGTLLFLLPMAISTQCGYPGPVFVDAYRSNEISTNAGRLDHLPARLMVPGRLPPARPARALRADQAHRVPARADPRPHREDEGQASRSNLPKSCASNGEILGVIEFLAHNMGPLMFAALVLFLLIGYPVAFALAAIASSSAWRNRARAASTTLFQALPQRIWAVMSNDTLLAFRSSLSWD